MSVERFIVCPCGHCIDQHAADGCGYRQGRSTYTCSCAFGQSSVLDALLRVERDAIHQQQRERIAPRVQRASRAAQRRCIPRPDGGNAFQSLLSGMGFVAGFALPSTKFENRRLGKLSDRTKARLQQRAQEQLEHAKDVIRHALTTS